MKDKEILIKLVKQTLLCLLSYALGYSGCSLIWILLPVILGIVKQKQSQRLFTKQLLTRKLVFNEEKLVFQSFSDLPAWVQFPDIEKTEWLNRIIKQLWPKVNIYIHDIVKELLQKKLNKKIGKYGLSGLTVEKLTVGVIPFRIGGIVVFENVSDNEIVLDLDVSYAGDCDIILKYSKVTGGIKNFQLYGRLRVVLKPLINELPLAGGIEAFFINPPHIDFSLDGLASVLEFPMLSILLKKVVLDTISSVMVLPNKFPIRLNKKVSKQQIRFPNPKGVLRVHLVQGRQLFQKDLTLSGQHTCDPYAVLTIGDQEFKTTVKDHTDRPLWDYWCEFIIEEIIGVFLYVTVWDKDYIQEDETLGRTKVELSQLVENSNVDMWLKLQNVEHGEIQLRTTWLTLSTNHDDMKYAQNEIQELQVSSLSTGILLIFVNHADDLMPVNTKNPELFVLIKVGEQEMSTKINKNPNDPAWEEGFMCLITSLEKNITFNVIDDKHGEILGEFVYNTDALFEEEDLQIKNQTFRLSQCKSSGKINLSITLRILTNPTFNHTAESEKSSDGHEEENETVNISDEELSSRTTRNREKRSNLSRSSSISSSTSENNDNVKTDFPSNAKIKLTLRYSVQRQKLIVQVHHIEDLHLEDVKGLYVKLYLLPERHKDSKRKTQVVRTENNPIFNETFEFLISQDELGSKHLEVSICEERVIKNEPIEKVVIDLEKLSLVLPYTRFFNLYKKAHAN
ncbi:hypothetical protein ABEB36_002851 [Hypothenemus hampei]|uniref:Uncharacterized protein n=1 Tax=Hypothenemus hampei TaxID=57062 RepID=A0ABD1F9V9_HYPHA